MLSMYCTFYVGAMQLLGYCILYTISTDSLTVGNLEFPNTDKDRHVSFGVSAVCVVPSHCT